MSREARQRLGTTLIILGVLAWVPYFVLEFGLGWDVPVYPFLTAHLLGVIPGSILRGRGVVRRIISRFIQRRDETP